MKQSRRRFLKTTAATAAAGILAGVPKGWAGGVYADDSPETPDVRFGMIALTDCSSIVMAHELGYFKKFGINSTVSKEASWAVIRDKLTLGENHATHMLIGMPFASTMGLGGLAGKTDGHSMAAQSERAGDHTQQQAQGCRREEGRRHQADCGQGEGRRRSADVRDDVPAGHSRDVDSILARFRRNPSGQGYLPHYNPAGRRWWRT